MNPKEKELILKTKLFDLHAVYGARFIEFAGYLVPLAYGTGTIKETIVSRQTASAFDVSHTGQINIFGDSASSEIDKLVPSNISSLELNKSCYSVLLNSNGGIIDDLIITKKNNCLSLVVNASQKTKVMKILSEQLTSKLTVESLDQNSLISVQGPKSSEVLKVYFKGIDKLKFMHGYNATYNNTEIYISRSGYTGEDGFELSLPNDSVENFFETLIDNSSVNLAGFGARDVLRIEAGLCLYGQDINATISPIEAGLSWLVSAKKLSDLSFLGSDVLKAQKELGPKMRRVGIELNGKVIPRNGSKILSIENKKIGFVTSGCFSPNLSKSICMGFISASEVMSEDIILEVRSKKFDGKIVKMPFILHKYRR